MNQLRRYTALAGAVLMVLAAACTTKEQGIAVTGVTLSPSTLTLGIGESKTLTAEVQPSDATNKTISWSTDDPSMNVIALSGNTVKGIAEGSATVTVTTADGNRTATCKVTVSKNGSSENPNPGTEDEVPVAGVSVSPASLSLTVGDEASLSAAYTPANATLKGQWAWSVDNPSVASIQFAGGNATIKALAAGSATVTASLDGKSATASITVSAVAVQVPDGTVDMGLPSGILWCTEDLGTDADHPYGQSYKWDDYGPEVKYNATDNLSLLEAADDRATQALGENYRTPTLGDWLELIDPANCTLEWVEEGGSGGSVRITSKRTGNTMLFRCYASRQSATRARFSSVLESPESNGNQFHTITFRGKGSNPLVSSGTQGRRDISKEPIRPVYAKRPVPATGISVSTNRFEVGRKETIVFSEKVSVQVQPSNASQRVDWECYSSQFISEDHSERYVLSDHDGHVGVGRAFVVEGTNGYYAFVDVYPTIPHTPAEAVDLGLPSGTKWASWDLGASSPEEKGFCFAWGETELKFYYDEPSHKWYTYDKSSDSYIYSQDASYVLKPEEDAAFVHWGGSWQMPTKAQFEELINKCSIEAKEGGWLVTGPNLKTIFLPSGRERINSSIRVGGLCYYTQNSGEDYPWVLYYEDDGEHSIRLTEDEIEAYKGCRIRPVQPKQ